VKKNIIFAIIFGLVFGLPLTALLVSMDMLASYWSFPYVVLSAMAVLLALRYMTLLTRKAGAASGRAMANVAGRLNGEEAARAAHAQVVSEQEAYAHETYPQMLLSLTAGVGALLATGIAAFGPIATFLLLTYLLGELVEGVMWATGLVIMVSGVAGVFWLRLIERFFGVRIVLPLIPLSVVWIAYAIVGFGALAVIFSLFE
jgi:hypothetical protein